MQTASVRDGSERLFTAVRDFELVNQFGVAHSVTVGQTVIDLNNGTVGLVCQVNFRGRGVVTMDVHIGQLSLADHISSGNLVSAP